MNHGSTRSMGTFTGDLMTAVFGRRPLETHVLKGTAATAKEVLDHGDEQATLVISTLLYLYDIAHLSAVRNHMSKKKAPAPVRRCWRETCNYLATL